MDIITGKNFNVSNLKKLLKSDLSNSPDPVQQPAPSSTCQWNSGLQSCSGPGSPKCWPRQALVHMLFSKKQIAKRWQTLSTEHCMLNIYCDYEQQLI